MPCSTLPRGGVGVFLKMDSWIHGGMINEWLNEGISVAYCTALVFVKQPRIMFCRATTCHYSLFPLSCSVSWAELRNAAFKQPTSVSYQILPFHFVGSYSHCILISQNTTTICRSARLPILTSTHPSMHSSVRPSVRPSVCLPVCLLVQLCLS
jgi:hypothetical protein